ncbi:MAG: SLC13 family permease [Bacteroidota bacterium]
MIANRRSISIALGPIVFIVLQLLGKPAGMEAEAYHVLTATAWIAIWWITEAIPIAVTALLPIILFPLTGALDVNATTMSYGHQYVFLYMGGFILAIAIEKWDLHRRIALNIISLVGTQLVNVVLGFMIATAFLSMWISNTATSVMMLPIGMAIVKQLEMSGKANDAGDFGKALMLSIAYSASLGGIATLVGTPPNLVFVGVVKETFGAEITFFQWLQFGLPISLVLLFICWKYLTRYAFDLRGQSSAGGQQEIHRQLLALGKMSYEEKVVLAVFVFTAVAWISRSFVLERLVPGITDTIIGMNAGILLFLLPASKKGERIITWEEARGMPWGIILLFGGGMALAQGFKTTGLALWIGSQFTFIEGLSLILVIVIIIASVNFLTEITSNLATTAMLLPILASLAISIQLHPYLLMVSATVAASCAFMLPVATPPNAVVFGSGYLRIPDMIRAGLWMNVLSIFLLTLIVYFLLPLLWDLDTVLIPLAD